MSKEELIKKMNDELFENETQDKEFFVLSLVKNHIEENYTDDDVVIQKLAEYEKPLETAYEIFSSYIDMQVLMKKVYKDFFIKGQAHRELVKDCVFCDQFYDEEDEFCDDEYEDEDDEGFIHDNEDC